MDVIFDPPQSLSEEKHLATKNWLGSMIIHHNTTGNSAVLRTPGGCGFLPWRKQPVPVPTLAQASACAIGACMIKNPVNPQSSASQNSGEQMHLCEPQGCNNSEILKVRCWMKLVSKHHH